MRIIYIIKYINDKKGKSIGFDKKTLICKYEKSVKFVKNYYIKLQLIYLKLFILFNTNKIVNFISLITFSFLLRFLFFGVDVAICDDSHKSIYCLNGSRAIYQHDINKGLGHKVIPPIPPIPVTETPHPSNIFHQNTATISGISGKRFANYYQFYLRSHLLNTKQDMQIFKDNLTLNYYAFWRNQCTLLLNV